MAQFSWKMNPLLNPTFFFFIVMTILIERIWWKYILDYETWEIVYDGPFKPRKKNEKWEDIPKPSCEWIELEIRKVSLNAKAMNA